MRFAQWGADPSSPIRSFAAPPDAARFRHFDGQRVALETPVGDGVRAALTAMGHTLIDERPVSFGGAQAIVRMRRGYAAGSDPRKDGMAVGY